MPSWAGSCAKARDFDQQLEGFGYVVQFRRVFQLRMNASELFPRAAMQSYVANAHKQKKSLKGVINEIFNIFM